MSNITINHKIFTPKFRKAYNDNTRYQLYFGGSSSGKSFAIMTMAALWAMEGKAILIIRANDVHIGKSVYSEITKAISRLKLKKYFIINKTDRTITSKISSGSIQFSGVQDVERLKSITPVTNTSFDTIICEESTELNESQFNQILLRQRGVSKFKKKIILLFNPVMRNSWIFNRFFKDHESLINWDDLSFEYRANDLLINKSTYKDNPYLGQEEIDTIESMKDISPYHFQVYGLGLFGVLGDIIFPNWEEVQSNLINKKLEPRCGIDFGYSDAITFTISFYNRTTRELIVADGLSYTKLSDLEFFAERVKEKLLLWGLSERQLITGDSSDPRSADVLRTFGLNMSGAIKGAGSKFAGIMFMKTLKLIVNKDFIQYKESLRQYTWKKNSAGDSVDETNHEGSDLIDSVRYALENDMRNQRTTTGRNNKILR